MGYNKYFNFDESGKVNFVHRIYFKIKGSFL